MLDPEPLKELCRRFGARPPQDELMARKLIERANQLARKRDLEPIQALHYLLSLMTKANEGDTSPHTASPEGPPQTGFEKKAIPDEENH